ncbi:MAG TPA: crosslink repair DNA glycosylase YcaQ family protein [Anaerolineales bacterium]|nr:crosslink repair DNA glycosylase YcaQ family protein [Anaerolineales bacterium]
MFSLDQVKSYRAATYRLQQPLTSKEQAIDYVNQRGFIFFWPINGITLPSLWAATAGDRPVAEAHDDPGHVTWGWKDSLLGTHVWYYAKVLRKKATIISLEFAPFFYALSENYGSPEEDYLTLYEQGRLTQEARSVYKAILDHGPLDTVALRKAARLTSPESDTRFNKALTDLQTSFNIVPTGTADAGAWHYAFIYDIVARAYPDLLEKSRFIGELDARQKLAGSYLRSVGAAQMRDLTLLFQWDQNSLNHTVDRLTQSGLIQRGLKLNNSPGEWVALKQLIP